MKQSVEINTKLERIYFIANNQLLFIKRCQQYVYYLFLSIFSSPPNCFALSVKIIGIFFLSEFLSV